MHENNISIGIIDDHQLFVKSLAMMINSFKHCNVVVEALSAAELHAKLEALEVLPDIMLIDVNMPEMNGVAIAGWLIDRYPSIHLVALSMIHDEGTISRMFNAGCCAFLLKEIHPAELENALGEIKVNGFYEGNTYKRIAKKQTEIFITQREIQFLQLICSDMPYKDVAAKMFMSDTTVDNYRKSLFEKLKVQSRVGLCVEAIRLGFVQLS